MKGSELSAISLAQAARLIKRVQPDGDLVRTARAVGTSFADEVEPKQERADLQAAVPTAVPI